MAYGALFLLLFLGSLSMPIPRLEIVAIMAILVATTAILSTSDGAVLHYGMPGYNHNEIPPIIKKDMGKGTIINIKLGSEGPPGPLGPPGPEGTIGPPGTDIGART